MTVFTSTQAKTLLPRTIADGMITEARTESTIARLSAREPQKFGETDYITFNDFPKAEFVEEGAEKASTSGGFGTVTAKPRKAQVTMRFSEEVLWADEDHKLSILKELAKAGKTSLARALDLGCYHRINPLTGKVISAWDNYVASTSKTVQASSKEADQDIRSAVGLLVKDSVPVNGLALDPQLSWDLANLQQLSGGKETGTPRYPSLGFGTNVTDFLGVPAAQGNTVSGVPEATDTGIRAFVGDFANGIRWGVQRDLPIELIRFGDPDGGGDLKRKNQIALRLEIVYGWYVFANRFAVIKAKTAPSAG